jgi:prepilin-type processing-associated H-X9-DG protein
MNPLPPRPKAQMGFTQTDLLMGTAAVALVSCLLVIPLTRVKQSARLGQCTSNLGTVSKAILQFAQDHNKTLPATVPGQSEELQWWYKEQVKSYAGLTGPSGPSDTVFACPDDRGYSDAKPFHQNPRFDYGSYTFNGVMIPGAPNIAGWGLSSIQEPKRTLLVMEWAAHAPVSWHRSRTGKLNYPFYSDAECVVGFVDGHVRLSKIYYDGHTPAYLRDPLPGYDYRYTGQ